VLNNFIQSPIASSRFSARKTLFEAKGKKMTHTQHTTAPLPQKRNISLHMVEMVFPNTTNHYGTMFGGKVLDLMDRAAFLASTRFSNQHMVTASMERIDFFIPIKNGNLVELIADIVYTGRTSMTVKVDLFSENPVKNIREHACQGYFHMVSVNENGQPIPVPTLFIETEEEKKEWAYIQSLFEFKKNNIKANKK
jgi:acyl-CoA hydrolase